MDKNVVQLTDLEMVAVATEFRRYSVAKLLSKEPKGSTHLTVRSPSYTVYIATKSDAEIRLVKTILNITKEIVNGIGN